jgi:alpha-L-fucosidase/DNA-binding FadR family transcriptional regulator
MVEGRPGDGPQSAPSWALEQIVGMLARGAIGPGDQLATERDLSFQLGVSRSSIREATSALVTLGLLDSRHGAGVFVTPLDPEHLLSGLRLALGVARGEAQTELLAVRALLAPAAAALAAARRSDEDIAHLHEITARLAVAATQDDAAAIDEEFHRVLLGAGENKTLTALLEALTPVGARRRRWRAEWPGVLERATEEHQALLAALEAADPEAARTAMALHILRTSAGSTADHPSSDRRRDPAGRLTEPSRELESVVPADASANTSERELPSWFRDAKIGIIVHWGLYSIPGWAPLDDTLLELLTDEQTSPAEDERPDPLVTHPFAEWYQNSAAIEGSPTWHHHRATYGNGTYADFVEPFGAAVREWNPDNWAQLFEDAGARYLVHTTKHHDGFLLWPSKHRNPNNEHWATSRDVVGDIATAVRARGMRFGVYYSGGIDWTFSNLPIVRMADVRVSTPRAIRYARYVDAQWRELIDRYEPDMLWNDIAYPAAAKPLDLFRDYYERVPDGIVTDRFRAETYDIEALNYARRHVIDEHPWEGVRALGLSFAWNRQETAANTLTGTELVHLLLDVVSKNGNLLLGVSPDNRGEIPVAQERALRELGTWLRSNGEAVYATRPWSTAASATSGGVPVRFTASANGDSLYLTTIGDPGSQVCIPGLEIPDNSSVIRLDTGEPLTVSPGPEGSTISIVGPTSDIALALRIRPTPERIQV